MAASNLIQSMLIKDQRLRLGCGRSGFMAIKNHSWFRGTDWDRLLLKKLPAPIVPQIKHPLDASNFDVYDEEARARRMSAPRTRRVFVRVPGRPVLQLSVCVWQLYETDSLCLNLRRSMMIFMTGRARRSTTSSEEQAADAFFSVASGVLLGHLYMVFHTGEAPQVEQQLVAGRETAQLSWSTPSVHRSRAWYWMRLEGKLMNNGGPLARLCFLLTFVYN